MFYTDTAPQDVRAKEGPAFSSKWSSGASERLNLFANGRVSWEYLACPQKRTALTSRPNASAASGSFTSGFTSPADFIAQLRLEGIPA